MGLFDRLFGKKKRINGSQEFKVIESYDDEIFVSPEDVIKITLNFIKINKDIDNDELMVHSREIFDEVCPSFSKNLNNNFPSLEVVTNIFNSFNDAVVYSKKEQSKLNSNLIMKKGLMSYPSEQYEFHIFLYLQRKSKEKLVTVLCGGGSIIPTK